MKWSNNYKTQNWYMDFFVVVTWICKTDTWISLYCYMDLSKLFYISHALCQIKPSWSFTETSKLVEASAFNLSCWMIHQSTQLHGFVVPLSMFCSLLSIIFIWLWFWCMSLNIEVYVQLFINIIDIIYFNISIKTKCEYVGLVNIEGKGWSAVWTQSPSLTHPVWRCITL